MSIDTADDETPLGTIFRGLAVSFGYLAYDISVLLLISILALATFVVSGIIAVLIVILFLILAWIVFPFSGEIVKLGDLLVNIISFGTPLAVGFGITLSVFPDHNEDGERTDPLAIPHWNMRFPGLLVVPVALLPGLELGIIPPAIDIAGNQEIATIVVAVLGFSAIYRPSLWLFSIHERHFASKDGMLAGLIFAYPIFMLTFGIAGFTAVIQYRLLDMVLSDAAALLQSVYNGIPILPSFTADPLFAAQALGISMICLGVLGVVYGSWDTISAAVTITINLARESRDSILAVIAAVIGVTEHVVGLIVGLLTITWHYVLLVLRYVLLIPDQN